MNWGKHECACKWLQEALSKLKKQLAHKWDFIVMQAEEQVSQSAELYCALFICQLNNDRKAFNYLPNKTLFSKERESGLNWIQLFVVALGYLPYKTSVV